MALAGTIIGWVFALLFTLLAISMIMVGNWMPALMMSFVVLLCLPPVSAIMNFQLDISIHPILRLVLIAVFLVLFGRLLLGTKITSIYKSSKIKDQFMRIYDEKMVEWPVPYEDIYIDTQFGKVHIISSGPKEAPPMLLLHASAVSSWSWKSNVGGLNQHFRTYAVDLIGDAGKSEFYNLDHIMKTGEDQADLYNEIMDKLGIKKAAVVGASEGGFIATNLALHYPDKVEKLALLGPMGYSGGN